MKILQISSVPVKYTGGTEKVILELSKGLSKKHEVTILQTNLYMKNKNFKRISNMEDIKIITCKNDFFLGGYGFSKEFKRILKNMWKNYEIVHIHGHGRFTSNYALKFLNKKKPTIFTAHGFFHSKKFSFFKRLHDFLKKDIIKKTNFCTALTKLDFRNYERLGVKKEKIVEIPNGVDESFFKKINKKELKKFKAKYNIKENAILYVGRIHKSKGLQYVIRSIKNLNTQFVIAGQDRGYKKELIKLAEKLKIKNKINFIGKLNSKELVKIYQSCNAFVLFSEWEGFGIVAIEAMASEKPVVVSDRGSLPFLVQDKENGFIVPFKDEKILEEKIKEILENKKKSNLIGRNGKRFAKKYIWKNIIKNYEEIYKKAILENEKNAKRKNLNIKN